MGNSVAPPIIALTLATIPAKGKGFCETSETGENYGESPSTRSGGELKEMGSRGELRFCVFLKNMKTWFSPSLPISFSSPPLCVIPVVLTGLIGLTKPFPQHPVSDLNGIPVQNPGISDPGTWSICDTAHFKRHAADRIRRRAADAGPGRRAVPRR